MAFGGYKSLDELKKAWEADKPRRDASQMFMALESLKKSLDAGEIPEHQRGVVEEMVRSMRVKN